VSRRPAGRHGWPARLLLAGAAAIGLALPATTAGSAATAHSAPTTTGSIAPATRSTPAAIPPGGASVISVTSITPTVAVPGTPVTITGRITARQRALTSPTVAVVMGQSPIRTRADVRAWVADPSDPGGIPLASSPIAQTLQPGDSVPFSVTVPTGKVSMPRQWGVVPIALALTDADSLNHEVVRTFVGWQRSKEYQPLSLAVVAPLTLSPSTDLFAADAAVRTGAWSKETAPGSRLDRIISGTDSTTVPVTWAIDPAVLGRDQRTAAQVSADPVTPLVAPLAKRIAEASSRHTVWALPYGDPDLAATVTSSPADPTVEALIRRGAALGPALGVPVGSGVAWLDDGGLQKPREDGLLTAFGRSALSAALVSSSSLPAEPGFTGTADRRSPSGVPILAWDDALSRLTLQTMSPGQATLMTQEFLAETATILAESPGINRTLLVAMPRTIDPDAASMSQFLQSLAATPWLQFATTEQVRASAATRDPVTQVSSGSWAPPSGPPQVDGRSLGQIAGTRQTIDGVAALFPDGLAYRTLWNDTLDQLPSTRWRSNPGGVATLSSAAAAAGAQATRGVRVADQTTNFLAEEGVLQVTVVNDLDSAVEGVKLVLTPTNPRMRILSEPVPIRIEKESKATVQVRVQAVAAGLVPVTAALTTSDGTPIGVGTTLTVRANPPGRTFYVVAGVGVGLLLVVGMVRSLRRRSTRSP